MSETHKGFARMRMESRIMITLIPIPVRISSVNATDYIIEHQWLGVARELVNYA